MVAIKNHINSDKITMHYITEEIWNVQLKKIKKRQKSFFFNLDQNTHFLSFLF